MSKKIVYLDPGHGGGDSGAIGNGIKEKDIALDIAKETKRKLEQYDNVEVRLTRDDDTLLSLSKRSDLANQGGADLFISIHLNAFNGSANGYEDYIYEGLSSSSTTAQRQSILHEEIYKAITSKWDTPDRGTKKANFAVLRQTIPSAILTENLFIDSNGVDGDAVTESQFVDVISDGHTNGVVKIFNLKRTSSTPVKEVKGGTGEMLQPSNHALNKAVQGQLFNWEDQGLSSQWREALEKRELSVSDAVALLYLAEERGYTKK